MAYVPQIDARLHELLPPAELVPIPLHEAMRYACLSPGKRLRPALTMAVCAACGGSQDSALDAGCAIEMVHSFSLIHDDLPALDNDDLRRGRPTCHKVFGEAIAILAGDALYGLAFAVMAASPAGLGGVQELAQATGSQGLVAGEALDILSEKKAPDGPTVEQIHRQKTGALFACCGAVGAFCAERPDLADSMREFGMSLGLAFQIADDLLNETSDAATLGKSVGSDRDLGKQTYPAVFGIEESRRMAEREVDRAIQRLSDLPGDSSMLAELAHFAVQRGN